MVKLSMSDYLEKKFIDYVLRRVDFPSPASVYLGLFTDEPSDISGTEVIGGSYARITLTKAFDIADQRATHNTFVIDSKIATANWGLIKGIGIFDSLTGGNLLFYSILNNPVQVNNGGMLSIDAGSLEISLEGSISSFLANTMINHILNAITFQKPIGAYLALYNVMPNADDNSEGTTRNWYGISINSSNGDVYAAVNDDNIYKQATGFGNFITLRVTTKNWYGISVNSSNGDVYATVNNGDIYKQTAGTGKFNALGQTARNWYGISVNFSNGDVYATVNDGDIYKQTAGIGNFVPLGQTARNWYGVSVNSSNGNVYACVNGGDIYKQTAGTGAFNALGQTKRQWTSIFVNSSNGDVYATVNNGDIYKQTAGTGAFNALGQTARNWYGVSVNSSNRDVYATVNNGDIYKQTAGTGTFKALGQIIEISGGGYLRRPLHGPTNWTAPNIGDPTTTNNVGVTFPVATTKWGTIVGMGIKSLSTEGNLFFLNELKEKKTIYIGDEFRFVAGSIKIILS